MLVQHRPAGVQPPRIEAPEGVEFAVVTAVDKTGGAVDGVGRQPPLHRAEANTDLVSLGLLALQDRTVAAIARTWLGFVRQCL